MLWLVSRLNIYFRFEQAITILLYSKHVEFTLPLFFLPTKIRYQSFLNFGIGQMYVNQEFILQIQRDIHAVHDLFLEPPLDLQFTSLLCPHPLNTVFL